MGWVLRPWRPFGSKPEPEAAPEVVEPEPAPAWDLTPDVPDSVRETALVLSRQVWDRMVVSRAELLERVNPPDAERYLDHAVALGHVVVDGDVVRKGAVNPRPLETVRIPNF